MAPTGDLDDDESLPLHPTETHALQLAGPLRVHPVKVYLLGLAEGSRRTMKQSLDRIAQAVMDDP